MYNEAQKKATVKYLDTLKEIRFRVKPDEFARFEAAASKAGYSSMRQFYLAAILKMVESIESAAD